MRTTSAVLGHLLIVSFVDVASAMTIAVASKAPGNVFLEGQPPRLIFEALSKAAVQTRVHYEVRDLFGRVQDTGWFPLIVRESSGASRWVDPVLNRKLGYFRAEFWCEVGAEMLRTAASFAVLEPWNPADRFLSVAQSTPLRREDAALLRMAGIDAVVGGHSQTQSPWARTVKILDGKDYREMLEAVVSNRTEDGPSSYLVHCGTSDAEGDPDVADFAETLKLAYLAGRAVDPSCRLEVLSSPRLSASVIDRFTRNRLWQYGDCWIVDTAWPGLPRTPALLGLSFGGGQALAELAGDWGTRSWGVSCGLSAGGTGRGSPEHLRAGHFARSIIVSRALGAERVMLAAWAASPAGRRDSFKYMKALLNEDRTPRGSYVAVATVARMLDGAEYVGPSPVGVAHRCLVFRKDEAPLLALWTTGSWRGTVSIPCAVKEVSLTDITGESWKAVPENGVLRLTVSRAPVFVTGLEPESMPRVEPAAGNRGSPAVAKQVFAVARCRNLRLGGGWEWRGDGVVTAGGSLPVRVSVHNCSRQKTDGSVILDVPEQWRIEGLAAGNYDAEPGETAALDFLVRVPISTEPKVYGLKMTGNAGVVRLEAWHFNVLVNPAVVVLPIAGTPSSKPEVGVLVHNAGEKPLSGSLSVSKEGWSIKPGSANVGPIAPGDHWTLGFRLQGVEAKAKGQQIRVSAKLGGEKVERKQDASFAVVVRNEAGILVDGKLDDWADALPIRYPRRPRGTVLLDGLPDESNFSAVQYVMGDAETLYIALDVRDDTVVGAPSAVDLTQGDHCDIQLDFHHLDAAVDTEFTVSPCGPGGYNPDNPLADNAPCVRGLPCRIEIDGTVYSEDQPDHKAGYVIEMALPLAQLIKESVPLSLGRKVRVNFRYGDRDRSSILEMDWQWNSWDLASGQEGDLVIVERQKAAVTPRLERMVISRRPGEFSQQFAGDGHFWSGPLLPNASDFGHYGGWRVGWQRPVKPLSDPGHRDASRICFERGFLEYSYDLTLVPPGSKIEAYEVRAELSGFHEPGNRLYAMPTSPSAVVLWLDRKEVGTWLAPGDPGDGGWLTRWKITPSGTFINGVRKGDLTLESLDLEPPGPARLSLGLYTHAQPSKGLNLHGLSGRHNAGVDFIIHYRR